MGFISLYDDTRIIESTIVTHKRRNGWELVSVIGLTSEGQLIMYTEKLDKIRKMQPLLLDQYIRSVHY